MVTQLQYVKDIVRDLSPSDMTEVLEHWLKLKDARLSISLDWHPQDKVDLQEREGCIFLQRKTLGVKCSNG